MKLKCFLKLILVLSVFASFTACTKNSELFPKSSPNVGEDGSHDPIEEEEGGISAGGGGTLPADPISVYEVLRAIDQAKLILRMSFNYQRHFPPREELFRSDKFMYGEKNLATQLEITDLEVLEDRPCKNKFGRDVDASIYASRPNTICLSAFRIAPKLIKEIATKEILALIAHELSHFLGANEAEAVEVQKAVAWDLSSISSLNSSELENKLYMLPTEISSLSGYQSAINDDIKKGNIKGILSSFRELTRQLTDFETNLPSTSISFGDYRINEYYALIYGRIRLAETFVETLDATDPDFQQSAKEDYEKCFNGQSEITAAELPKDCRYYFGRDAQYPFYKFQKMTELSQLTANLYDVFQYIHDYGAQVRAIVFNNVLPYFNLPTQNPAVDPWTKFQGSYVISEKNYSSTFGRNYFENLETIVIQPGTIDYPVPNMPITVMVEKGGGMTSWYNIGNGVNINAMFVNGGANWAGVEESRGTRWYDRQGHGWSRTTKTVREENGQLTLEMKSEMFRCSYTGTDENSYQCLFKLAPQN